MSAFSDVDAAGDPARLIASLDESSRGLASMKHYMAVVHRRHARPGVILDLGCGAGHDIAVLAQHGITSVVGVDPSAVMLDAARATTACPLTRAGGERLPFRDGAFAGCWIERVLMHVREPAELLAEVVRCVEPGGILTLFEPDWSSLTVNGWRVPAAWTTSARHPSIGSEIGALLGPLGCFVLDRVEERSWWTFPQFEAITNRAIVRAAASAGPAVNRWIDDVRSAAALGTFEAEMTKVMWVATTRALA